MRITAKLRTMCSCGRWVDKGDEIEWDRSSKRTAGCVLCNYTGKCKTTYHSYQPWTLEYLYEYQFGDKDWY